jgi:hypothetical protein
VELAKADAVGTFSLFNHTSLEVPMVFGSTGSAVGNVHDSSYVALLPWLGVLGLNVGDVVRHMKTLGSVTWKGAKAKVLHQPAVFLRLLSHGIHMFGTKPAAPAAHVGAVVGHALCRPFWRCCGRRPCPHAPPAQLRWALLNGSSPAVV